MALGFGSTEGYSPADPPFAQLGGAEGLRERTNIFAQGAFNAIAPGYMKEAVRGAGEASAFLKRQKREREGATMDAQELAHEELIHRAHRAIKKHLGGGQ